MKLLIEKMLSKPVDVDNFFYNKIIKEFRGFMLAHFQSFDVSENTMRLAKTASMLDPCHMIQAEEEEISPFIEHVLQILEMDVPHASAPETQFVGPSQELVSLEVNIPITKVSKPKSQYAFLLNPDYGLVDKKNNTKATSNSASAT